MICKPCSKAGNFNSKGRYPDAAVAHANCTGCDCQHKTGPTEKFLNTKAE